MDPSEPQVRPPTTDATTGSQPPSEGVADARFAGAPGEGSLTGRATGAINSAIIMVAVVLGGSIGAAKLSLAPCVLSPRVHSPTPLAQTHRKAMWLWAMDDSHWLNRRDPTPALAEGTDNAVWRPGEAIHLVGLPGETVAFQVVVSSNTENLRHVSVHLESLAGPAQLLDTAGTRDFRSIETFVPVEVPMKRRSGGKRPEESLGWGPGAEPPFPSLVHSIPDPLVPASLSAPWLGYPFDLQAHQQGTVWIDVTLPEALPAGTYRGVVEVRGAHNGEPLHVLGQLPVELTTLPFALPYGTSKAMVFADPGKVLARTGSPHTLQHLLQLLHRHQVTTLLPIDDVGALEAHASYLTGQLFTTEAGYAGPGKGVGPDVVALGAYGTLGDPTVSAQERVAELLEALRSRGLSDSPGQRDVFLYAIDERCASPRAGQWRDAVRGNPRLAGLRVAQTCGEPPSSQNVDIVILPTTAPPQWFTEGQAAAPRQLWLYNGVSPHAGPFLSDAPAMALRANPWLARRLGATRWFYWESAYWTDDNAGGWGPFDPFATTETFHNAQGDHANGDGVLAYPGSQLQYPAHSLGYEGVIASRRLKLWRRGLQDVGYLRLAEQLAPDAARQALSLAVPWDGASAPGPAGSWDGAASRLSRARRLLFDALSKAVIPGSAP